MAVKQEHSSVKNIIILILICLFVIFFYIENNIIAVTEMDINLDNLPKGFEGYRIVHLSDLHSKVFSSENSGLISKVQEAVPDIIVITGDFIDYYDYDEEKMLYILKKLQGIAPVYYVTGNHELAVRNFPHTSEKLAIEGISVLRNSYVTLTKNGDSILLIGIDDPVMTSKEENMLCREVLADYFAQVPTDKDNNEPEFQILLTHRPEQISLYAEYGMDLVFAGHAHGGQIRLPFIGGLYAPNQGFFPKYTSGKYTAGSTTMIVSRGLGNGTIPIRLNNRPEIVVAVLHSNLI